MADDSIEIVVIAPRIDNAINYSDLGAWSRYYVTLAPQFRITGWDYGVFNPNVSDKTSETYIKKFTVVNNIETFQKILDNMLLQIDIFPPTQVIDLGLGFAITMGELRQKVSGILFEVYHKQFSGPGYGGANYGSRVEINDDQFSNYVKRDPNGTAYGANFLILHEIAHNTAFGNATRSLYVNQYRDTGSNGFYGDQNPYFIKQESAASGIARKLADALGLKITSSNDPNFPTYGFLDP